MERAARLFGRGASAPLCHTVPASLREGDMSRAQMSREYSVYIMTNKSRTLYTGVTNDLMRRVYEHKNKLVQGFTSKYNIQYLVYYESTSSIHVALEREKQIKGWLRAKKIALINSMNPEWKDLSEEWFIK
jgi:putative endonuclease